MMKKLGFVFRIALLLLVRFDVFGSDATLSKCHVTSMEMLDSGAEFCSISEAANFNYFEAERYCKHLCSAEFSDKGFLCPRLPRPAELAADLLQGSNSVYLDSYHSLLNNGTCLVFDEKSAVDVNCHSYRVDRIICVSENNFWPSSAEADNGNFTDEKGNQKKIDTKAKNRHNTDIVAYVNSLNGTWKAELNPSVIVDIEHTPGLLQPDGMEFVKSQILNGAYTLSRVFVNGTLAVKDRIQEQSSQASPDAKTRRKRRETFERPDVKLLEFPEAFDARLRWPKCTHMSQPTINQGMCGSCFALSTVAAISDRICVASNQTINTMLSASEFLSCNGYNMACNTGGGSMFVLEFWLNKGLITGGGYGSRSGCWPYDYPSSCGNPCPLVSYMNAKTVKCRSTCSQYSNESFENDRFYGKRVYYISDEYEPEMAPIPEKKMQWEIMNRGPVIASFVVAEDFLHYKSGIYQYAKGEYVYGHVVRIIGWGVENGTPYWIAANSWGNEWGEKGFFRTLRGTDHMGIELSVAAGIPKLDID